MGTCARACIWVLPSYSSRVRAMRDTRQFSRPRTRSAASILFLFTPCYTYFPSVQDNNKNRNPDGGCAVELWHAELAVSPVPILYIETLGGYKLAQVWIGPCCTPCAIHFWRQDVQFSRQWALKCGVIQVDGVVIMFRRTQMPPSSRWKGWLTTLQPRIFTTVRTSIPVSD